MRGMGLGRGQSPLPGKKIFLYTGSVVRVSAMSSLNADLRNDGPPEWRTPGMADRNRNPHHKSLIEKLEKVQKRATKLVINAKKITLRRKVTTTEITYSEI